MRTTSCFLVLSLLAGCFGSFQLTRTVYAFNEAITQDPILREALFVGFLIVPVYEVAAVVDGVVLNTIELATGDHPLETSIARTADGRRVAVTPEDDGSLTVEVQGQKLRRVLREGRRLELVEGTEVVAVVEPLEGGGVRVSAAGTVRELPAEEVEALRKLDGAALMEAVAARW